MGERQAKAGPLALRPDVVATVLQDGAVLLDLETKYFYQLNTTGWAVTQLFEAGATLDRVEAACRARGATDRDKDRIREFVDFLIEDGLVIASDCDSETSIELSGDWVAPRIEKQPEPLQRVMVSAFDPSIPLAE